MGAILTVVEFSILMSTASLMLLIIFLLPLLCSKTARLFYLNFFRKKPVILIIDSSMRARFENAKYNQNMLETKNGAFFVTPQSSYQIEGYTISIAHDRYASTLPHKLILFSQKCVDADIENLEDAQKKNVAFKLEANERVRGETLRVQDVVRFFMYDLNPALIHATLERIEAAAYSAAIKRVMRQNWIAMGIMVCLILVGFGLMFFLMSGGKGLSVPGLSPSKPIGIGG